MELQPGDKVRLCTVSGEDANEMFHRACLDLYDKPIVLEFKRPEPKGLQATLWRAVGWIARPAAKKAEARLAAMRAEQYPAAEGFLGQFAESP